MLGWLGGRQNFGFALETSQPLRVVRQSVQKNLDGYVATQLSVLGPIHLAHSASADGRENLVRAEFVACKKWQVLD